MNQETVIHKHLKDNSIEVYFPGQNTQECTSNFVVVKNSGSSRLVFSNNLKGSYDILCYCPVYSEISNFVLEVKTVLATLAGIKPSGTETPPYWDEQVKAHMVSVTYQNYKKEMIL